MIATRLRSLRGGPDENVARDYSRKPQRLGEVSGALYGHLCKIPLGRAPSSNFSHCFWHSIIASSNDKLVASEPSVVATSGPSASHDYFPHLGSSLAATAANSNSGSTFCDSVGRFFELWLKPTSELTIGVNGSYAAGISLDPSPSVVDGDSQTLYLL